MPGENAMHAREASRAWEARIYPFLYRFFLIKTNHEKLAPVTQTTRAVVPSSSSLCLKLRLRLFVLINYSSRNKKLINNSFLIAFPYAVIAFVAHITAVSKCVLAILISRKPLLALAFFLVPSFSIVWK